MKEITIPRMTDTHVHPREQDDITRMVFRHLHESGFARIVPVFNYKDPVVTAWQLESEQRRFKRLGCKAKVSWSIMLTQMSKREIIRDTHEAGAEEIKWMPGDCLSTNSRSGVCWKDIGKKYPCLDEAQELRMRVKVHLEKSEFDASGKAVTPHIWREFLPLVEFDSLVRSFPGITFIIAHISTRRVLRYLLNEAPSNVIGEITAHHLFRTFFDVYNGCGIPKGEEWCMPIFKFPEDRDALIEAATSGNDKLVYGSDKAWHTNKNPLEPPPGIYPGLTDICLLAQRFDERGRLENLKHFTSGAWAKRFGLPPSTSTVTLVEEEWTPPKEVNGVQIFSGGQEKLKWRVKSVSP